MYEGFTDRARKAMELAHKEALRLEHDCIGTEHLLIGLLKEGSSIASIALKVRNIDLQKIRSEIGKIVQYGPGGEKILRNRLPLTPRVYKALKNAVDEACNLNHNYVGTEHLLLGILKVSDGVAAMVLKNLGFTLKGIREEVLKQLELRTARKTPKILLLLSKCFRGFWWRS